MTRKEIEILVKKCFERDWEIISKKIADNSSRCIWFRKISEIDKFNNYRKTLLDLEVVIDETKEPFGSFRNCAALLIEDANYYLEDNFNIFIKKLVDEFVEPSAIDRLESLIRK